MKNQQLFTTQVWTISFRCHDVRGRSCCWRLLESALLRPLHLLLHGLLRVVGAQLLCHAVAFWLELRPSWALFVLPAEQPPDAGGLQAPGRSPL